MGADTATDPKAAEKAAKEAERAEKAKQREAEREAKAKEREEAKAAREKEKAEAKAKRELERKTKILKDVGLDPADLDLDKLSIGDVNELAKKKRAEDRANRPKKAPLTLSQRRAVLNLADAGKNGIVPKTGFNALPLDYLVSVQLAETFETKRTESYQETVEKEVEIPKAERKEDGPTTKTVKEKVDREREVDATGYRLTDLGVERAKEINPKWQTWKPDHSGDAPAATEDAA